MRLPVIATFIVVAGLQVTPVFAERRSAEEMRVLEKFCNHQIEAAGLYVDARDLGAKRVFAIGTGIELNTSQEIIPRIVRMSADYVWGKSRPTKKEAQLRTYLDCAYEIGKPV